MVRVPASILFILSALLTALVSSILTGDLPENSCVCLTEDAGVARKAGYQYSIIQVLLSNTCVLTAGGVLDIYGTTWYNLKVNSRVLWCSGDYLSNGTLSSEICISS